MPKQSAPVKLRAESELRAAVATALRASGLEVEENVPCAAGAADLATPSRDVIIECKIRLTRPALHRAIGQLLLYRQCLNQHARMIIIGYAAPETAELIPIIAELSIEVVLWQDAEHQAIDSIQLPTSEKTAFPMSPAQTIRSTTLVHLPYDRSLRWNIATLARARGILTASALATFMNISRQSLYPYWNDLAAQVTVEQITRFAIAFQVEPGDWFIWNRHQSLHSEPTHSIGSIHTVALESMILPVAPFVPDSTLVWNIATQAKRRGVDMRRLGYRAELQTRTAEGLWLGTALAVAVTSLERVALALDQEEQPFAIGRLFLWSQR